MSSSAYWYLTRSSGTVALLLLTTTTVLGVIDVRRIASWRWPRFAIDGLHRNIALLTFLFLAIHIITSVLDSFAPISLTAALVPFVDAYRPFWLGLGALGLDILVALLATSLLRRRLGLRAWRAIHWSAYACWPIALLHALGTGSDVKSFWMLILGLICVGLVLLAAASRILSAAIQPNRRALALGVIGLLLVFLCVWVPTGPLAAGWARRSGTPSDLLAPAAARSAADASHAPGRLTR